MNGWYNQVLSHPLLPWLGWAIVAILGIGAAIGQIQKRVPEDPVIRIKKTFGIHQVSDHFVMMIAAMWIALVIVLFIGLITFLFDIISHGLPANEEDKRDFRFLLTKTTALTAVLGGVVALPLTAIRLKLTAEQTRHASDALFNDKLHQAINDLHSRFQVTEEDGDVWKDDVIRRNAAIDRLEALTEERPEIGSRVVDFLSSYLRVLSDDVLPSRVPEDQCHNGLLTWARRILPARSDMEKAAQTIGRILNKSPDVGINRNINLENVNFQGVNLRGLSFKGADLSGSYFNGTNLEKTDFEGANLFHAQFQGVTLIDVNFQNADLGHADLRGSLHWNSSFIGADLSNAKLQEAILSQTVLDSMTKLETTDLTDACLVWTDLSETRVTSAQLDSAFANTLTKIPVGLERPSHWIVDKNLDFYEVQSEWAKFIQNRKTYTPSKELNE